LEKKIKPLIIVAVLAVVGYIGFTQVMSLLFYMDLNERMKNFPRFATPDDVLALPNQMKDAATKRHLAVDKMTTTITIEGRVIQGDVLFFFVVAHAEIGSKKYTDEARIESQATLVQDKEIRKKLEEAGVKYKGCG
jgi:hypothetical protein